MNAIFSKLNSFELRDGKCRTILVADFLLEIDEMVFVESRPFIVGYRFFGYFS